MSDIMQWEHGLAVREKDHGILLHFVLYLEAPSQLDMDLLEKEMELDPELSYLVEGFEYDIIVAQPSLVELMKKRMEEIDERA